MANASAKMNDCTIKVLSLIDEHQPVTATKLARLLNRSSSNLMHKCRALEAAELIEARVEIVPRPKGGRVRLVKFWRTGMAPPLTPTLDLEMDDTPHDVAWTPRPWIHPIRRAFLENKPMKRSAA